MAWYLDRQTIFKVHFHDVLRVGINHIHHEEVIWQHADMHKAVIAKHTHRHTVIPKYPELKRVPCNQVNLKQFKVSAYALGFVSRPTCKFVSHVHYCSQGLLGRVTA